MSQDIDTPSQLLAERDEAVVARRQRWRDLKDKVFRHVMGVGGIGVIIAILLIFFYLFYVVVPLFQGASIQDKHIIEPQAYWDSAPQELAVDEYAELGMSVFEDGKIHFFSLESGASISEIGLREDSKVTSLAKGAENQRVLGIGYADGAMQLIRHDYAISFPDDQRKITPRIDFPLGEAALVIDEGGAPVTGLAVQSDDDQTTVAAVTSDERVLLVRFTQEESFLDEESEIERQSTLIDLPGEKALMMRIDVDQEELYLITDTGYLNYYRIEDLSDPALVDRVALSAEGSTATTMEFLSGGISLLIGDSDGAVSQWFPVRGENNVYKLEKIRTFSLGREAITSIAPEYARKSFAAASAEGRLAVFHTTAERSLINELVANTAIQRMSFSPRSDAILARDKQGQLHVIRVDNEHPEVSLSSLWGEVWYESRQQPEYIWQSSSASNDFEPKFSLTPLTVGTLKAAFYAMLFAVPIAISGAIFTAYFMAPKMRNMVKPAIEIMEALPTVILGFLAGLWLAPLVEKNMPGIFLILILLPIMIFLAALIWQRLPQKIRHSIPDGWEAALLIPVVVLVPIIAMSVSQPLEAWLFNDDMPTWVTSNLGLDFDQRNSLVVGIAMGFAVIPTIFSISEDAIFSVPKHLTMGSLALGATRWQTLVRVVILTASPGIFSALMIGLGRAVGETMIVLMATGNTPIMDFNIFQGFRALSANIAVEMPEAEVDSTHYRILFLAALVLFLVTFFFNTIAELVRQRLREKYSNL